LVPSQQSFQSNKRGQDPTNEVREAEALVCTSSEAAPEPPAGDQPESETIEPP
jgi:hypothetical protein